MVKSIKMFVVAATAALLAMAVLGAGSASATVLCKENTATCSAGNIYPSGTSVAASLKGKFELNGAFPLSCTGSTLSGKTKAEKGAPLPIEVTGLTLSGCSGCPFTPISTAAAASNLPYTAGLTRSTEGDGTVAVSNGGKGTPILKITCTYSGSQFSCGYSLDGLQLGFDGGNPATIAAAAKVVQRVEGLEIACGSQASLSATYELTSPKPAYASAGPGPIGNTVFCKEAGTVCPSNSAVYPNATAVEGKAVNAEMDSSPAFTCDSTVSLKNTAESGKPLPISVSAMSFSNCSASCQVKAEKLPFGWSATATENGNGTIKANLRFSRTCPGFGSECVYEGTAVAAFSGGSTPIVDFNGFILSLVSGSEFICGGLWTIPRIKYTISSPTPLYLGKYEA